MFKCKGCGRVYADEECFSLSAEGSEAEDSLVFDGKEMRHQCPACGGLVYPVAELAPAAATLAA